MTLYSREAFNPIPYFTGRQKCSPLRHAVIARGFSPEAIEKPQARGQLLDRRGGWHRLAMTETVTAYGD